jgi:hypothetical protein
MTTKKVIFFPRFSETAVEVWEENGGFTDRLKTVHLQY